MCFNMFAWCRYTRGRIERTHGDVLNLHTGGAGEKGGVHRQFCLPKLAHVWLSRASEVQQRKFWIFSSFKFENRSRTTCPPNFAVHLIKLFSFSNLEGNFGENQQPDGSICLSNSPSPPSPSHNHDHNHHIRHTETGRQRHKDRETEEEDREKDAAVFKLASPSMYTYTYTYYILHITYWENTCYILHIACCIIHITYHILHIRYYKNVQMYLYIIFVYMCLIMNHQGHNIRNGIVWEQAGTCTVSLHVIELLNTPKIRIVQK